MKDSTVPKQPRKQVTQPQPPVKELKHPNVVELKHVIIPWFLMGQMDLMDLRSTHSPKTNMEPENQLFEKETHLPNISKPSFAISVLVFGGSSQVLVDCPDWKDSLFLVARPSIPPVTSLARPT